MNPKPPRPEQTASAGIGAADSSDQSAAPASAQRGSVNDEGTALRCLVAVAAHHGIATSASKLVHEHALGADEPTYDQLAQLARSVGLLAKRTRIPFERLAALEGRFPLIARLTDGSSVIVAGTRRDGDQLNVALFDPRAPQQGLLLVRGDAVRDRWTGDVLLAKRGYALDDPHQPFGFRWFIPELLRQKTAFRDVAIAAFCLYLVGLAVPIFFQLVIDKVLVHESYSTLYVLVVGVVLAVLFESAFGFVRQFLLLAATNRIDIRLATRTFAHLVGLPIDYFEARTAGVILRNLQQVERIRQFLTGRLFMTVLDSAALLVFVPVLLLYSVKLTLIVLGFALLIAAVIATLMPPFRQRLLDLYNAEAERQGMLVESIQGMRTVKSLAIEPLQRKHWDQRAASAIRMHYRVGKISISANAATTLLERLMLIAIIAVGVHDVFDRSLSIGALIAFQMLSNRVVTPLVQIASLIQEFQETAISVRMLGKVMNHPPEQCKAAGLMPTLSGAVEFDRITFRYQPAGPPVIDRLSLKIAAGSVVGVVGRSGCGKTTLTRLLQGLGTPQEGVIRLDGVDIREIDLAHLRRNMGVVLQDTFLFRGTIRENISATRPGASAEDVVGAARIAGADEFIEQLPQGYETPIEENGANLSGGQKQRLAIARALMARPRFLILDEATSALDPESESLFMTNLARIAAGRTVIIVSHRLSTLVKCDKIVVLDAGQSLAEGTHADLVAGCPLYQHLWSQQNRNVEPGHA